jgi:hypothetical protein
MKTMIYFCRIELTVGPKPLSMSSRVTRLGEFSHRKVFLKITEVVNILGYFFPTVIYTYVLNMTIKRFGYILDDFFTKSSGHPDDDGKLHYRTSTVY